CLCPTASWSGCRPRGPAGRCGWASSRRRWRWPASGRPGRGARAPNPYMASSVNRRTADGGRFLLLPRRSNRTAVDRLPYGCRGLSDDGVSVELHQTLLQGSAALARGPRRLRDRNPAPEKLLRTPTPALQNAGLI